MEVVLLFYCHRLKHFACIKIACYISDFSVSVIKHIDKTVTQRTKWFILPCSSILKEQFQTYKVHPGGKDMAISRWGMVSYQNRSWKIADYISSTCRKQKHSEHELMPDCKTSKFSPTDIYPPVSLYLQKFHIMPTTGDKMSK